MESKGTLSIVATPIGNLEDVTHRAVRVLKEADYILCEDTRVTGKLLAHYGIKAKLSRYDAHASEKVHEQVLADLGAGKHIALVSDAGTPGVSDPGVLLVQKVRSQNGRLPALPTGQAGGRQARIDAIPGPSSITAAFSIAGIAGNQFVFLGFVPQKKGRQTFFKELLEYDIPVMFLESTHRIMKTLTTLLDVSTNTPIDWSIVVARELTKMHEEVVRGTAEEVLEYFESHLDHQKGEFVIIVSSP
jgi:16S rRNA (cytidine1402-2'-O)-methyltransferase